MQKYKFFSEVFISAPVGQRSTYIGNVELQGYVVVC
jgi:hypothetical protein